MKRLILLTMLVAVLAVSGTARVAVAAGCPAGTEAVFVTSVSVPGNTASFTSSGVALTLDETYLFEASGTYTFHPGWIPDAGIADAKCSLRREGSNNPGPGPQWIPGDDLSSPFTNWLEISVDDGAFDWGDVCEDVTHEYSGLYIGDGTAVDFSVKDSHYDGNDVGDMTVDIYFCDPAVDADNDGVEDAVDSCPNTAIPEAAVPTARLGINRFALVDADTIFDTTSPSGRGPGRSYTMADTGGCSCEQIIEAQGLGKGHEKFGCSISAMDAWVASQN